MRTTDRVRPALLRVLLLTAVVIGLSAMHTLGHGGHGAAPEPGSPTVAAGEHHRHAPAASNEDDASDPHAVSGATFMCAAILFGFAVWVVSLRAVRRLDPGAVRVRPRPGRAADSARALGFGLALRRVSVLRI